jgi:hypothetical protein
MIKYMRAFSFDSCLNIKPFIKDNMMEYLDKKKKKKKKKVCLFL